MKRLQIALIAAAILLSGCDQVNQRLGLEDPAKKEARQDAEGRAVGSACRQSGRAIEDCYAIYYWLPKASIFAGWREMNDYMLSNKLEIVQPRFEPPGSPEEMRKKRRKTGEDSTAAGAESGEATRAESKGDAAAAATTAAGKSDHKSAEQKSEVAAKGEAPAEDKAAKAKPKH